MNEDTANTDAATAYTPPPGRVAGIDFGTVRIGVALSNSDRTFASPYETFARRDKAGEQKYFCEFAAAERVKLFVVGLPIHLDGNESKKSLEARQFGQWLTEITEVPVVFFDERFTSSEAKQLLAEANLTRKKRKQRLDAVAAQVILSSYLESDSTDESQNRSIDDGD